jgi:hypothetical protein
MEVGFIVGAEGTPYATEINPRLAGTVKVAAMSAGVRVFDLPAHPEVCGHLPARETAIEAPWHGPPIISYDAGILATSRIAASGSDRSAIEGRLRSVGVDLADLLTGSTLAANLPW